MRRLAYSSFAAFILLGSLSGLHAQAPAAGRQPDCNCGNHVAQPYTAEFRITLVKTLANGTTITRESTEIEALDSSGRRLRSTTQPVGPDNQLGTSAHVNDPTGGVEVNWQSSAKRGWVIKLPPQDERHGCWADDTGNFRTSWFDGPRPGKPAPNGTVLANGSTVVPAVRNKPEEEDLGTSSIQGVEVRGHRLTTTFPAGQFGNDAPIVATNEAWSSQQLALTLREVTDDPRLGKRTRELVNLVLGEPDDSLFRLPDSYEVTTEELHSVPCAPSR